MDNELVKVIIIGDTMVGKTSFIQRYVNNTYRDEYKSTIGVDFAIKLIRCGESKRIRLQLWDIAGQERFAYLTRAYYKDAKGCLLMFDIGRPGTFNALKRWKEDLDLKVRKEDGGLLPCLLLANKCDAAHQVSQDQIVAACNQLKCIGWMEVSVKTGAMVEESMSFLLDSILFNKPKTLTKSSNGSIVTIAKEKDSRKKSSCPC